MLLVEIIVPTAWSPPRGPEATFRESTRPVFLNNKLPVVPVAISGNCSSLWLCMLQNSIKLLFILLWAIKARYFFLSTKLSPDISLLRTELTVLKNSWNFSASIWSFSRNLWKSWVLSLAIILSSRACTLMLWVLLSEKSFRQKSHLLRGVRLVDRRRGT